MWYYLLQKLHNICCPKCNQKLGIGIQRIYETLIDHVFDPNAIPPKRYTLVCTCSPNSFFDWAMQDEYIIKEKEGN